MGDMAAFRAKYSNKIASRSVPAPNGHCMLWTGSKRTWRGIEYGKMCCKWQGKWKRFYVHRLTLLFDRGWHLDDIAGEGIDVSHLCHNNLCINPLHLSYEPHQTNRIRSACVAAGSCNGHFGYPACLLHLKLP